MSWQLSALSIRFDHTTLTQSQWTVWMVKEKFKTSGASCANSLMKSRVAIACELLHGPPSHALCFAHLLQKHNWFGFEYMCHVTAIFRHGLLKNWVWTFSQSLHSTYNKRSRRFSQRPSALLYSILDCQSQTRSYQQEHSREHSVASW